MAAHQQRTMAVVLLVAVVALAHAALASADCVFTAQFLKTFATQDDPETIDVTFEVADFTGDGKADIRATAAIDPTSLSNYPNLSGSEDLLGTLFTLNGNATALYDIVVPGTRSKYPLSPGPADTTTAWLAKVAENGVDDTSIDLNGFTGGSMLSKYDAGVKWGDGGATKIVQIASFVITSKIGASLNPTTVLNGTEWAFRLQSVNNLSGASAKCGGTISIVPNCTAPPPTCSDTNRPAACASSSIAVDCTTGSIITQPQVLGSLGNGCLLSGSSVALKLGGTTFLPTSQFTCSVAGTSINATITKPDGSCYPLTITYKGKPTSVCDTIPSTCSATTRDVTCTSAVTLDSAFFTSTFGSGCLPAGTTVTFQNAATGAAATSATCGETKTTYTAVVSNTTVCYRANFTVGQAPKCVQKAPVSTCNVTKSVSCSGTSVTLDQEYFTSVFTTNCLPSGATVTWSPSGSVSCSTTTQTATATVTDGTQTCYTTKVNVTKQTQLCDGLPPTGTCATAPYATPCSTGQTLSLTYLTSLLDASCKPSSATYALFNASTGAPLADTTCPYYGSTDSVLITVSDGGQACYNYTVGFTNTDAPPSNCATACTLGFDDPSNATVTLTTSDSIGDLLATLPHPSGGGTVCAGKEVGNGTVLDDQTIQGTCFSTYTVEYNVSSLAPACNATLTQKVTLNDDQAPVFDNSYKKASFDCAATPFAGQEPTIFGLVVDQLGPDGDNVTLSCASNYDFNRTYTATSCGTAYFTQTVQVRDTTAPAFGDTSDLKTSAQCGDLTDPKYTGTPPVTDDCSTFKLTPSDDEQPVGDGTCGKTITRTWTAKDACGNSDTYTQTITVKDTTKPTWDTTPGDVTVECGDSTDPKDIKGGPPTATDNCAGDITIKVEPDAITNGDGGCGKTIARNWTATDKCGNVAVYTQTIKVVDTTKPTFDAAFQAAEVECGVTKELDAQLKISPTATDVCDGTLNAALSNDTTVATDSCTTTRTRTWNATDACGNSVTQDQVIVVKDTKAPTLAGTEGIKDQIYTCSKQVGAAPTVTASDLCDGNNLNFVFNTDKNAEEGACADDYTLVRTWTATDKCGKTATHTQTITVKNNEPPTFTDTPKDTTVECSDTTKLAELLAAAPNATDACGNKLEGEQVAYREVRKAGDDDCGKTITRTWTATDACGNQASTSQVIKVEDTTKPTVTVTEDARDKTYQCDSEVKGQVTLAATDNCDSNVDVQPGAEAKTPGACDNKYTLVRTWTATDDCGLTDTHTQTITVDDTTKPTFANVPASVTLTCAQYAAATFSAPTAQDNCGSATLLSLPDVEALNSCGVGTITHAWQASDACRNTNTATQTITISDNTAPTFTSFPPDVSDLECGTSADPEFIKGGAPTATDDCGGGVTITYTNVTTGSGCNLKIVRTWKAADCSGNFVTKDQTITVKDTKPPTLTGLGDAKSTTVQCASLVPPAPSAVGASDTCDANVKVVNTSTALTGACANNYTLTRTWTATDCGDNTNTYTQTVVVSDTTKPGIVAPLAVTVECKASIDTTSTGNATASDNCGTATVDTYTDADDVPTTFDKTCRGVGTITRTFTARDLCGNTNTTTQVITVADTKPPTFTSFPINVTVECGSSTLPAATGGTPSANDTCAGTDGVTVTYNDTTTTGSGGCGRTITRTWRAQDCSGNFITRTQTITVVDTTKPTLSSVTDPALVQCPANISAAPTVTASDTCDGSLTPVPSSNITARGGCANRFTLTRTWTATDKCRNSATVSQAVVVNDNTPPQLAPVLPMVALCIGNPVPRPTCSDNCGNCTVLPTRLGPSTSWQNGAGTETWGFQATDGCQTTAITPASTTAVKYCSCSNTAFAGPSQWQYKTLSDTSAGIKGGPWYAIDPTRWGWGVALTTTAPRVVASYWSGAGQNDRSKGVNGGNVTIARSGQDVTVTFSLFPGSEAPVGDMHIAAQCSQVLGSDFGNSPFLQSPRNSGLVVSNTANGGANGVYQLRLPASCASTTGYVVVHNGGAKTCPP